MPYPLRFQSKKGRIRVVWVWNQEGTKKLVNGKQHSVWFTPTGMKGLPQNLLLIFRSEFLKSGLTIYLPFGISEIFCQMVSTPGVRMYSLVKQSQVVCSHYHHFAYFFLVIQHRNYCIDWFIFHPFSTM